MGGENTSFFFVWERLYFSFIFEDDSQGAEILG